MTVLAICTAVTMAGCAARASIDAVANSAGSRPTTTAATTAAPAAPRLRVVATLKLHQITRVVPTPTSLWALGGTSRKLTEVDPRTNTIVRTLTLPHPAGFGIYSNGSLWLSSFADSVVMQVDPSTGTVVRTTTESPAVRVDHPVGLVATGTNLWVVQHRRGILTRIDTRTGKVISNTRLPGQRAGDPVVAAGRIWIPTGLDGADGSDTAVVRVDPATARVDGPPIHVGAVTCASESLVEGTLWLTSTGAEPCSIAARALDTTTSKVSPVQNGPGKDLYELASAGGTTWVSDTVSTIYRLDPKSGQLTPSLTLDGDPDFNRLLTAFGSLWVSRGDTGRLLRIQVSS
jgi:streptogramin lyase